MKVVALDRAYYPHGGYGHWCPGCNGGHEIDVEGPDGVDAAKWTGPKWGFNRDLQRPTFTPSINIRWGNKVAGHETTECGGVCHYFITDGMIIFCGDSTHTLAGQTVPLPDLPEKAYFTSQWKAGKR